jgi:hypothetical protein
VARGAREGQPFKLILAAQTVGSSDRGSGGANAKRWFSSPVCGKCAAQNAPAHGTESDWRRESQRFAEGRIGAHGAFLLRRIIAFTVPSHTIAPVLLIDQIPVVFERNERSIALYSGDLSEIPAREAVDLLVVSAFPNSYHPTLHSLIGALHRSGVSVRDLATRKAVDLRQFSSCWLSEEISQPKNAHFKRILCFEPPTRGSAPELVGDVFRSLVPFCGGSPAINTVAMPILASGDQRESPTVMLKALLEAALHWFMIGLSINCLKIVILPESDQQELGTVFRHVKATFLESKNDHSLKGSRFDAFLSYSRKDQEAADYLHKALMQARPSLRLFVDRLELQPGAGWQQHIFEALDDCHKVISLLSPSYTASKVCKEEFNIALFRHRDTPAGVLLPIQLRSTELPTYMKLVQSLDAREDDYTKLAGHVDNILTCLSR